MATRLAIRPALRVGVAAVLGAGAACTSQGKTGVASGADVTALVGATIYTEPGAAPIPNGALVIGGERILAVGQRDRVEIPRGAVVLDVSGRTVLPAFWNSHVHFTEPKWAGIDTMPAERAAEQLRDMLMRFGFVHVVDAAGFPEITLALRCRARGLHAGGQVSPHRNLASALKDQAKRRGRI